MRCLSRKSGEALEHGIEVRLVEGFRMLEVRGRTVELGFT